ncbi:MAG: SEC-C domain-containing protein [Dokdonella sp.]
MPISHKHDEDPGFNMGGAIAFIAVAVARGESFAEYSARALGDTDYLMPPPAHGNLRDDPGLRRSVALALIRALWRQMPDPQNRFAPAALPHPERNALCHCGSGHKYKKCCEPIERSVPIQHMNLLPQLISTLPKKRWAELVGSRISLDMVAATASDWSGEGRDKDALALLEPWFVGDNYLDARHEILFDLLLNVYTNLGKPRKKSALLERGMTSDDRLLRSAAMQRNVTLLADAGNYRDAWIEFRNAQREDPDSPSLSHLEVIVLLNEGREADARERAQFWVARLQKRRDPDLVELIDMLKGIAEHGGEGMLRIAEEMKPGVAKFISALRNAPPVSSAYLLQPAEDSAGPLMPVPALENAHLAWEEAFPGFDLIGEESAALIWITAPEWQAVLDAHPILWQSFEVIPALMEAVMAMAVPGTEGLINELAQRGERLLREVIRANAAEGLKLEWGWMENREALSLLGDLIVEDLQKPSTDESLARLEWLVLTLNPNDNQGFRDDLLRGYLECGRLGDALALSDRYPDDLAPMRYNRALTLFALGEIDKAATALGDAIKHYPKPLACLLKVNPKVPKQGKYGIAIGGDEEAWIYRNEHLHLWNQFAALEWARERSKSMPKNSG